LKALGLKQEDRARSSPARESSGFLADVGILCAGGATTTIYPSNSGEDCAYILQDSGTVIAFVENDEQIKKSRRRRARSERSRARHVRRKASADGWVITLDHSSRRGRSSTRRILRRGTRNM